MCYRNHRAVLLDQKLEGCLGTSTDLSKGLLIANTMIMIVHLRISLCIVSRYLCPFVQKTMES